MKAVRTKNRIKALAVSITVCLAIVIGMVFSFGFGGGKTVSAAERAEVRANETGIRFVQVAAGEGFAIGLTYDDRLFGWSTKADNKNTAPSKSATSLGYYYTTTPTEINVTYRQGPAGGSNYDWSNNRTQYHTALKRTDDRIQAIAATRTTAAFITANGYIYTWGKDSEKDITNGNAYISHSVQASGQGSPVSEYHYLLLRPTQDSQVDAVNWYEPYIVDYNYYDLLEQTGLYSMIPAGRTFTKMSLAAGENNYIVSLYTNPSYRTYVWGSLMYAPVLSNGFTYAEGQQYDLLGGGQSAFRIADNRTYRRVYATQYTSSDSVTAVAGGYTVGLNATLPSATGVKGMSNVTTLTLKGKNFLTSVAANVDGDIVTPELTVNANERNYIFPVLGQTAYPATGLSDIKYNSYVVENSIIGGVYNETSSSGIINVAGGSELDTGTIADLYFARQAATEATTSNFIYSVSSIDADVSGISGADNNSLARGFVAGTYGQGSEKKYGGQIILNAVSLGNDIGYGIRNNGKLYAWGDNTNGQSGKGNTDDDNYGYPEPITPDVFDDLTFKSVAAGKQLSAAQKAFNADNTFTVEDTTATFSDEVKNEKAYITGVLTTDGDLYVWSDKHYEPTRITFSGNESTKFAAIYSGYERNIFAITELGKLVHITCDEDGNFSQKIHDYFVTSDSAMTNWTVDASSITSTNKSSITFAIPVQPTKENRDPAIGTITLYIDNATASEEISVETKLNGTAVQTDTEMPYGNKARQSLVSTNAVGDAYRILSPADAGITYVKNATGPANKAPQSAELDEDELKPKFSFKAKGASAFTAMPDEEQWSQMFSYEFVGEGSDIGIAITPKRSTQNGTVNVSFYIARFDNINDPENANYYDYLPCNIEFTVANSTVVQIYESFGLSDGRSTIPLLDPNNEYNKYYSLAVQDVSNGFIELAKFLTGEETAADGTNAATLVTRIKNYLSTRKAGDVAALSELTWDPGFPDKNKIEKGQLTYYLGEYVERDWYKDAYWYLFADRDLDVVQLTLADPTNTTNLGATRGIKTIKVALTGLASGENALNIPYSDELHDDDLQTRINKQFENIYGLTGITVGADENEQYVDTITFSYQVLLFTANGSTGRLDYGDEPAVDSFKTTAEKLFDNLEFNLAYQELITFKDDFTTKLTGLEVSGNNSDVNRSRSNWSKAISVFAQPTARMKNESNLLVDGKVVYGAAKSGEGYTANNHLEVENTDEHFVGDPDMIIPLGQFIGTAGSNVTFSFGNKNDSFGAYKDQFKDSVTGENYLSLTQNQITVKFLGAHPIYFTVTIQRFIGADNDEVFASDERITISFVFTTVRAVAFSEPPSSTQLNRTFNISREMYFYVFGETDAPTEMRDNVINRDPIVTLASYRDKMTMTRPTSSNFNVLNPIKESNSVIRLVPGESGKAVVQFTLSVFGKDIPIKLTFNVSGVTTIKDTDNEGHEIDYTVNLADVQYVYLSTLTTGLSNAVGKFIDVSNYGVLYDDKVEKDGRNIFEGVDFVPVGGTLDGTPNKDKSANDYYAKFVKNIDFYETGSERAYMRIDINSDATHDQLEGEYIVYVKFVDIKNKNYSTYEEATGDTILRAAFKLKANKQVAFVDGAMLEIVADVDHPKKSNENDSSTDWYMTGENTEAKIYVPLRFLCDKVGIANYNEYEIYLVSAAEGSAKYINPVGGSESTRMELEITPLYNTKAPITLNVSIRNKTKGQSENQVIAFSISVKGISTVLSKGEYTQIWLVAFFSSLGLLMVIFLIRMIIYWRRRAKQRALIKRNQELIKMRDKVHNKATTATRDQALKTKLKLQDPKYAKMFNEMKKDQNGGIGVATVGETMSAPADNKSKKKKKGGKKSMAELKAELAAKKAAFAQAQAGGDPFGGAQGNGFGATPEYAAAPDFGGAPDFGAPAPDFGSPTDMFSASDLDGNSIIFDAPDIDGQA